MKRARGGTFFSRLALGFATLALVGCPQQGADAPGGGRAGAEATGPRLKAVAVTEMQWTGIAVTADGRIFVNFPRWSDAVPVSVAEMLADGTLVPFPDEEWNRWEEGLEPQEHFVCVQSVYADDEGTLWILDPASPQLAGVVAGGPKLLKVDVNTREVLQQIAFSDEVAPAASYLNDVRVDTGRDVAYITDSGAGALVVVDLTTGESRRVLDGHPSTRAEEVTLTIGGRPWVRPDGNRPQIHADGIALDPSRDYLYFQALTGHTLYRVPTASLLDAELPAVDLGAEVETVAAPGAADGLAFDAAGNLYLTSLEHDAIRRLTPAGEVEVVVQDPRISWPDSLAVAGDGSLYFTTSQIHLGPTPPEPYRIFQILDPDAVPESSGAASGAPTEGP